MRSTSVATIVLACLTSACGSGGSTPAWELSATAAAPPMPLSNDVRAMAVGDVDGDGLADLVVADGAPFPAELSWRRALGDGTFGASTLIAVHVECQGLVMDDLTADGWLDLVLCDQGAQEVRVFVNRRDGSFDETASVPFATGPSEAATGDVDGDGRRDVAVAFYGEVVALRATDGLGGFEVVPLVTWPAGVYAPALADVDGDGLDDLVASTEAPGGTDPALTVWVHDGPMALTTPVSVPAYSAWNRVRRGHLDHDGLHDLVAIDATRAVGLAAWDGTSFTETPSTPAASGSTVDLAVADLDGDGWSDAVVAHRDEGFVSIERGDGFGRVVRDGTIPVTSPQRVAVGDVDGDGRPDLVVYSGDDDAVRVFLGR